uniref:Putative GABA receptor 6 n=1 Tax=Hirudo verbana TaxID=311461 RepID=A0A2S1WLX9_9ANNE|nr:putative GABA receptor 6 [Hirudo verbana]
MEILAIILLCCQVFSSPGFTNEIRSIHKKYVKSRNHKAGKTTYPFQTLSAKDVVDRLMFYYNDQEPPMKDRPTEVKLGIYINSFYSISEQTMDYSVSMYLRQFWRDPRLMFPPIYNKTFEIRMGETSLNRVWIPDTFFRNEKRATFHEVTVNNRLMRLNATGHLWYVTKISATLSCPMKLEKYPLDIQSCPMMFESFGYTMDTLYFTWLDNPVDIEKNLEMPQFSLQGHYKKDCSQNYTAGAFPCQEIRFLLRRDVGYFLIQVYIPSMLIVILSWVSFWINVDASPARVSIGLLTVLTTTTQSSQSTATLPRVSYIKAIDVWMSVCLVFVFAALLEYAAVNVLSRRKGARIINPTMGTSTSAASDGLTSVANAAAGCLSAGSTGSGGAKRPRLLPVLQRLDMEDQMDQTTGIVIQKEQPALAHPLLPTKIIDNMDGKMRARKVDCVSRRWFPITFILFNIIYWLAYAIPFRDPKQYMEIIEN